MFVVHYAIGIGFVAWVVLTVLYQFDRFAHAISRFDHFRLIPRWTFFAPNPGEHDLHLLVRDQSGSGEWSVWREVHIAQNSAIPPVWNPDKRIPKILWDCWASIRLLSQEYKIPATQLPLSGAYLVLLNLSLREPPIVGATARQFSLVCSKGFATRAIDPLFLSSAFSPYGEKPNPGEL